MKTKIRKICRALIVLAFLNAAWVALLAQSGTPLPKFNILDNTDLVLETEKLNDYDYRFTIVDKSQDKEETFVVMPLTEQAFVSALVKALGKLAITSKVDQATKDTMTKGDSNLIKQAKMVFIFVQSAGITSSKLSAEPTAGILCMEKSIRVRQYLRVNSYDLKKQADKFLVIKIKKRKSILQAKTISSTPVKSAYNMLTEAKVATPDFNFRTHRVQEGDVPDSVRDFVSDKKGFLLLSKANSKLGTFEFFDKRSEALNRLDYLAAKFLTREKDIEIEGKNSINKSRGATINHYNKSQALAKDSLEELTNNLQSIKRLQFSSDSITLVLNSLQREFNQVSKELGYELLGDSVVDKREYVWSRRNLSVEEARWSNKDILANLEADNSDWTQFVEVLKKMVFNQSANNRSTEQLTRQDYEILKAFPYYMASGKPEPSRGNEETKMVVAYYDNMGILSMKKMLLEQETILKQINSQRSAAEKAVKLLDHYISGLSARQIIQEELTGWDPKKELSQNIERLKKIILSDSITIDSFLTAITVSGDSIGKLHAQSPIRKFHVEYANIEFNQGYIENIVVFGKLDGSDNQIKFTNVQPIGFSRSKDYDDLRNYDLWTEPVANSDHTQYSMNLGAFISNYQQNLELNRRDYSPADGARKFDLEQETCTELKKAPSYQLIEGRIYTDFVGLDSKSPNGLIQTEIGHKINLITNRLGRYCWGKGGIRGHSGRMLYRSRLYRNAGWFGYIHPMLVLSKIENNNRSLLLSSRDRFINNVYDQQRFASTIELRNYEYLNTGFDLNIRTWDVPFFKSTFYFDLGLRFGRTQVIDSVRTLVDGVAQNTGKGSEFGVNTFRWYPKWTWEIKPEERYGLSMAYSLNQYYLMDASFKQISVPKKFAVLGENEHPFTYGTAELQAYFNPSVDNPTGKLFFRYTFNHQFFNWNTNFHQAQVGYSFFFQGRNKERTQPD